MLQPKLTKVEPRENFTLILTYETGEHKVFDVAPYIKGEWFGQLRDTNYFKSVSILPNGHGIVWPDGQDIAPHELYELSTHYKCDT